MFYFEHEYKRLITDTALTVTGNFRRAIEDQS